MLRNRELRQFVGWFLGIAAATVALGFCIGMAAGILAIVSAASFGLLFFIVTRNRLGKMNKIVHLPGSRPAKRKQPAGIRSGICRKYRRVYKW